MQVGISFWYYSEIEVNANGLLLARPESRASLLDCCERCLDEFLQVHDCYLPTV